MDTAASADTWSPVMVLGATRRALIAEKVKHAFTSWLQHWGMATSDRDVSCDVVENFRLLAVETGGACVGARSASGQDLALMASKNLIDLLITFASSTHTLVGSSGAPVASISARVEERLAEDLLLRVVGSGSQATIARTERSADECVQLVTRSRWIPVRIFVNEQRQSPFLLLAPELLAFPESRNVSPSQLLSRRTGIQDLEVQISAEVAAAEIRISDLAHLEQGDVLLLDSNADQQVVLMSDGVQFARGALGRNNGHFAVEVLELFNGREKKAL